MVCREWYLLVLDLLWFHNLILRQTSKESVVDSIALLKEMSYFSSHNMARISKHCFQTLPDILTAFNCILCNSVDFHSFIQCYISPQTITRTFSPGIGGLTWYFVKTCNWLKAYIPFKTAHQLCYSVVWQEREREQEKANTCASHEGDRI